MISQTRRREGAKKLELVRNNRARMSGVGRKGVLPDFAVEDYLLVASVRQPGITPKLMNMWKGPWRVVQKQEDMCTAWKTSSRGVRVICIHIAWMPPHADTSLSVTAELKEVFNNLKIQGEFDMMERIEAEDLTAESDEYVVKVKWVGLEEETT